MKTSKRRINTGKFLALLSFNIVRNHLGSFQMNRSNFAVSQGDLVDKHVDTKFLLYIAVYLKGK